MKLLARHDPHPALFDAYAQALPELAAAHDAGVQAALRAFELILLREIGVLPDLGLVTLTQQPLEAARHYVLLPDAGVAAPRGDSNSLSGALLLALQEALAQGDPAALRQACGRALPELKSTLRGLLHYHLGSDQLRTRQVLLTLPNSPLPLP